ncbi:hypothetical protein [Erythrobacter sp. YT30]|uniref:hypothetical protein n=1 Tax=Erythrobacter sp. YT30 TaxID=1735012 RepID=UPI00076C3CD5|nr:hypothetical protein [Erythrobacter sp. YT30]KWV93088.1 hypothetical protein AUC45_02895 [Erythrobacter sp. YT30]
MSSPTFRVALCLSVAAFTGCSALEQSSEAEGERVSCAIGEGVEMSEVCSIEKVASGGADIFLIHHPDGGFRRIAFDLKTQELGVADGADSLRISDQSTDDITDFMIGSDRYRVPSQLIRQSDPAP